MNKLEMLFKNKKFQFVLSSIFFVLAIVVFVFSLKYIYKNNNKKTNDKTNEPIVVTITNEAGETITKLIDPKTNEEVTTIVNSETGEVITITINPETGEEITTVITKITSGNKTTEKTTQLRMKVDANFSTIDDFKKSNISVNKTVHTNGYYKAFDGGEGYYKIEEKSNQTIDNGKYILLDNGLVASLIPVDNTYNVKQFGAIGNDSNDDTTAIANAIKNLSNVNVYIPSGTYMISSRVTIPSNPKGFLMGAGITSVLKAVEGTKRGSDILRITNGNNITLKNFAISGNSDKNTREQGHDDQDGIHLLDVWGVNNLTIDNCYFIDNIYTGIRLINNINNTKIINSTFKEIDCGIEFMGHGNADHITIENNSFDGHKNSEPITFFGTGRYTNLIINKNTLKNKQYAGGIYLGGYPDSDAYFENVTVTYNNIDRLASGIILRNAHTAYINNNTITETLGGEGIRIASSENVEIMNNSITRSKHFGLQINSCKNVTAKYNTFNNCGYANNDFFFTDIRGENENVLYDSNTLNRTDESLVVYVLSAHSNGGVTISNNKVTNGKFWLGKTSANLSLKNNNVAVRDDGTNNTIIN